MSKKIVLSFLIGIILLLTSIYFPALSITMLGAASFCYWFYRLTKIKKIKETGIKVKGSFASHEKSDEEGYAINLKFKTVFGELIEGKPLNKSYYHDQRLAYTNEIDIAYDPENPTNFVIQRKDSPFSEHNIFLLVALIFFITGSLSLCGYIKLGRAKYADHTFITNTLT